MVRWRARVAAGVAAALLLGIVVPAGAATAAATPVAADEPTANTALGLPLTGALDLGGLAAKTGDADGSFALSLPVGGHVTVSFDSRTIGVPSGLASGWNWGLPQIDVDGGVRVVPASGGVFELDASHPSGLAGYGRGDLVFSARGGALAGRPGVVGDYGIEGGGRSYTYALEELGGTTTYFSAAGDPITRITAAEARTDWSWDEHGEHRLIAVADEVGVLTDLVWHGDSVELASRHASGAGGSVDRGPVWRVLLDRDRDRIVEVVDPIGGATRFAYDDAGRPVRVGTPTGAVAELTWRTAADGAAHVDELVIRDHDGVELRRRTWTPVGGNASGWPAYGIARDAAAFGAGVEHRVELAERHLRTVSVFGANGTLLERQVHAAGPSGERMLQTQQYTYPEASEGGTGGPVNWSLAERAVTRFADATGETRELAETFEFDGFGRQLRHVAGDGTVTEREYDGEVQAGRSVPIGLAVNERVTAPDGAVVETRRELNEARIAPAAVERWTGGAGSAGAVGAELERTARAEYEYGNAAPFASVASVERVLGADGAFEQHGRRVAIEGDRLVETTTDASGASRTAYVDPVTGAPELVIDGAGRETRSRVDALGRVVETRFPDGSTTFTEHRRRGDGDAENAVITSFGADYRVKTVTDEFGGVIREADTHAVDPANLDAEGWRTRSAIERDERGNPVRVTDQAGLVTSTTYDETGEPVEVRLPDGSRVESTYDAIAGTQTQRVFEPGAADPSQSISTVFDQSGREIRREVAYADGTPSRVSEQTYDGFGRELLTTTDEAETRVSYAADGSVDTLVVTPIAGAGPVVTAGHERDGFGRTTRKTLRADGLAPAPARSLAYGDGGLVRSETDQLDVVTAFEYDPAGALVSTVLPDGSRSSVELDAAGREKLMRFEDAHGAVGAEVAREYQASTGLLAAVWDPADPEGSRIEYDYHPDGLPRSKTYPDGRALSWEYDDAGRLTAATDAVGARTSYTYDAVGRLVGASQVEADASAIAAVSYAYDGAGNLAEVARGNGDRSEFEYDDAGQVQRETHTAAGVVLDTTSSYDRVGQMTRSRTERTAGEAVTVSERRYEYDGHGRLVRSVHEADGDTGTADDRVAREYTFDLATQLMAEETTTVAGSSTRTFALDAAGRPNAVLGEPGPGVREYDAAGRLIADERGIRYEYAPTGALSTVVGIDGERTEHTYWADGTLRATMTADQTPTTHYWDTSSAVPALTNEVGADASASYLYGLVREHRDVDAGSAEASAEAGYYLTDRQGSVLALSGTAAQPGPTYEYGDYGDRDRSRSTAAGVARNPFTYTGAWEHPATGHLQLGTRFYDAATATFIAPDAANTHAKYAYAAGNPVRYTDPTGRTPELTSWLTVGFAAFTIAVDIAATIATGGLFGPVVAVSLATALASGAGEVLVQVDRELVDFIPDEHTERLSAANFGVAIGGAALAAIVGAAAVGVRAMFTDDLADTVKPLQGGISLNTALVDEMLLVRLAERISREGGDAAESVLSCPGAAYSCAMTLSGIPTSAKPVKQNVHAMRFAETADLPGLTGVKVHDRWTGPMDDATTLDYIMGHDPGTHFVIMGTWNPGGQSVLSTVGSYLLTGRSSRLQQNHYSNAVVLQVGGRKMAFHLDGYSGKVRVLSKKVGSTIPTRPERGPWRVMVAGTIPAPPNTMPG